MVRSWLREQRPGMDQRLHQALAGCMGDARGRTCPRKCPEKLVQREEIGEDRTGQPGRPTRNPSDLTFGCAGKRDKLTCLGGQARCPLGGLGAETQRTFRTKPLYLPGQGPRCLQPQSRGSRGHQSPSHARAASGHGLSLSGTAPHDLQLELLLHDSCWVHGGHPERTEISEGVSVVGQRFPEPPRPHPR